MLAVILVVYSIATGLQPQIVRASAMTVLGLAAYMVRRDPDALSALSISGIAYLLWRPDAIYGMPFQLSFVAVAAIAIFFRRSASKGSDPHSEFVRITYDCLRLSAIILIATTPLIAYYLGMVSTVSVIANLMLWWCLPLAVGIAFCAHGIALVVPSLGDAIASHFLGPLTGWIDWVLGSLGSGFGSMQVPGFSPFWLLAFYGAWLMTYRRRVVQP
jgi:competence protein ComEC